MALGQGKVYRVSEILILCSSTFAFIATLTAHVLAFLTDGNGHLGFINDTETVWLTYRTEITPAPWIYAVWGVIYTWQALWIIYGWSFVCRPTAKRIIPLGTYGFFILSCALYVGWLFTWGNGVVVGSLPFIALTPISLAIALAFVLWTTYMRTYVLRIKYQADLWATRIIVHNGIAFFVSWFAFEWLIQLTVVVTYKAGMQASHAATMSLTFLFVEIVAWFVLEHTFLDRFTRYIHSVYIVIIFALSAVVAQHWSNEQDSIVNRGFSLALLAFTVIVQVCRIAAAVIYSYVKPIQFPSADT
jgi:hypothetical protein